MKVNGSHVLHASRQQVWEALQDPAVLVRTIPGCQTMTETGDDTYTATVHAGIASIKGTYDGQVSLADQDPPNSYTLRAKGSGGPGTIDATATVSLTEEGDDTRVEYDAHAIIGGAIAGVGQRVVSGVAKRNAKSFFQAVDKHLAGELEATPAGGDDAGAASADGAVQETASDGTTVFRKPEPVGRTSGGMPDAMSLILAALAGAAIALFGVLVGQRRRS